MTDIVVLPGRGLDFNYRAVLDRARALGYTLPTPSFQHVQSQLMRALKYGGVFNKTDVLYVFANNGSKEFATINWKTPASHQATIVNSASWAKATGFTGNATDMYLDTNFNPATQGVNYAQDNANRFAWVSAYVLNHQIDGTPASSVFNRMVLANSLNTRINQGSTNLSASLDFRGSTGLRSISRTSSTNVEGFNGTTQTSLTATSAAITSENQVVLRSGSGYSGAGVAIYGMGASLVAENAALNDALNTYMAMM
jgi:hypothetical protein